MALKRLTTEEMVQISGAWVRPQSPARAALLTIEELVGLLPRLDAAHADLVAAQPDMADPRLAALMREAADTDLRHDSIVRGVDMVTAGYSLLLGDHPKAALLKKARDVLLPDGLAAIQKTFRAEAGAAELLQTRLAKNPDIKAELALIPVFDQFLMDYVSEWITCAEQLGALEDERASLVKTSGDGMRLVNATNRWIRTVNALVANAVLAELDPAVDTLLFGPLRLAEAIADRRVPAKARGEGASEPPSAAKDVEPA